MNNDFYKMKVTRINGSEQMLSEYSGKVLLVVNVASKCGLTPQYEALEKVYEKYQIKGFEVLGFPANEFDGQEPGSNAEIQEFCQMKFGIKFPMFAKMVVKGEGQHPLYNYLTRVQPKALANNDKFKNLLKDHDLLSGTENDIMWNFEKFLVARDGRVVARFSPEMPPDDPKITAAIERALM